MTVELIIQSVAIIVGALFSAFQIRNLIPRSRSRLKLDLEILELLDSDHPRYADIQTDVDRRIEGLYPRMQKVAAVVDEPLSEAKTETLGKEQPPKMEPERRARLITKPADFRIGVVMLSIGIPFIVYLLSEGLWGWAILPAMLVFLGFGGVLVGMEKD